MCFEFPERLFLLWLLLPLAALMAYGVRKKVASRERLADDRLADGLLGAYDLRRDAGAAFLRFAGFALLLLACCGPQICSGLHPVKRSGLDIAYVLDVSNSMRAGDVHPDRLGRAKQEIARIAQRGTERRRSLVAFAGSAVLQCPLTADRNAFDAMLDAAAPELLEAQGTNLRSALDMALRSLFPEGSAGATPGPKAVVLLTDGEDHAGGIVAAGRELQRRHVRLVVVGIGGDVPATIPSDGEEGGEGAVMVDASGKPVGTSLDAKTLGDLAAGAGGLFLRSDPPSSVADRAREFLQAFESGDRWVWEPFSREPLFQPFVLLSMVMLLAADLVAKGKNAGDA